MEPNTEIITVIEKSGLAPAKAKALIETFTPMVAEIRDLIHEAEKITVTDATQVTEIKAARVTRLKLRAVRVKAEAARKSLKEDVLHTGRAIDAAGNWLKDKIEPAEARLEEMEKFAERREAERKAALKLARETMLKPYGADWSFYNLGDMPEEAFQRLYESSKIAHETAIEKARKAEEERIRIETERKAEEERIRAENERLKKEREAIEAQARAEREKAEREAKAAAEAARKEREAIEAKARAEREAAEAKAKAEREAIEAQARKERAEAERLVAEERRLREEAEAKARAEREAAERKARAEERERRKAELAPDKDKIAAFGKAIRGIRLPSLVTPAGKACLPELEQILSTAGDRIDLVVEELESTARR